MAKNCPGEIMKNTLFTLVLLSVTASYADTVRISCHPIPFKNQATITATVNVSTEPTPPNHLKANGSLSAELRRHINGAQSFRVSGSLSGRVATATLTDAQGNPQILRTFFASSETGDIARLQLAIGANTGMTANSFIQTRDGFYYHAKCNVVE